jgi:hypothetical protein
MRNYGKKYLVNLTNNLLNIVQRTLEQGCYTDDEICGFVHELRELGINISDESLEKFRFKYSFKYHDSLLRCDNLESYEGIKP